MRLTAVYDDHALRVELAWDYTERHHVWELVRAIDEMGTRTHASLAPPDPAGGAVRAFDRWTLPREHKDTLRDHLLSLPWADLTWTITKQPEAS